MKKVPAKAPQENSSYKKRGGRPPAPTPTKAQRRLVLMLAGFGMTHGEIAQVMDMAEDVVERDYKPELRTGLAKADSAVVKNLFRIATSKSPQAVTAAIFWTKVRRRWHEIQRVIHGFDPDIVQGFVRSLVSVMRRELPETCPHCKTRLDLPKKLSAKLLELSKSMMGTLAPSEIVPMPPPQLPALEAERKA